MKNAIASRMMRKISLLINFLKRMSIKSITTMMMTREIKRGIFNGIMNKKFLSSLLVYESELTNQ